MKKRKSIIWGSAILACIITLLMSSSADWDQPRYWENMAQTNYVKLTTPLSDIGNAAELSRSDN